MKTTRNTKVCKKCGVEIPKGIFCRFHQERKVIENNIWHQQK
jgi:hypothetical protein